MQQDKGIATYELLSPTNDYVFKRIFGESPELLLNLINDLRYDLPKIASVEILNPNIEPSELQGKYIVLDVLARDPDGNCYNVEIQVRKYSAWPKRGIFYLARTLGRQLKTGEDYQSLRASIGLHLLDFDLFDSNESERRQAIWRFEMRDETQPNVTLGNILQMNLIELSKADRLGVASDPVSTWIKFFKHWREENVMADIDYEPVKTAYGSIKKLSADEEAQRLAFVRERALHDEVSFINEAKRQGREEGLEKGRQEGLEQGLQSGRLEGESRLLRKMIQVKFGEIPPWADDLIRSADSKQIDLWVESLMTADSLESLLGHH